jgi:hypothetical protein
MIRFVNYTKNKLQNILNCTKKCFKNITSSTYDGIDTSGYYLCEGIWLDPVNKTLNDRKNGNNPLDIRNISSKILIFEREISEWLFHPMITLMSDDNDNTTLFKPFKNGIFILFGSFTYIEKMQRYRDGEPYKTSKKSPSVIIKDGFKRIFTNIQSGSCIDKILAPTRHTLMHEGMVGDDVLLNYGFNFDIQYNAGKVNINPIETLKTLRKDFDNYIEELKQGEDSQLVDNFKKVFDEIYNSEIKSLLK